MKGPAAGLVGWGWPAPGAVWQHESDQRDHRAGCQRRRRGGHYLRAAAARPAAQRVRWRGRRLGQTFFQVPPSGGELAFHRADGQPAFAGDGLDGQVDEVMQHYDNALADRQAGQGGWHRDRPARDRAFGSI
jgi:hypothetical protein